MLNITAIIVNQTNQTIEIQVSITAVAGSPGILSAQVMGFDQAGGKASITTETPGDCPADIVFIVPGIPRTSLPIYIGAYECVTGVDVGQGPVPTTSGPWFGEQLMCKPMGQNVQTPTCTKLKNEIQTMRNNLIADCAQFAIIKGQRDVAAGVAAGAAAAWVTLSAVAATTPWPFSLFVAIAASVAAIVAIIAGVYLANLQASLNKLGDVMTQLRIDINTLITRLSDFCCPEFMPTMLDLPSCPS